MADDTLLDALAAELRQAQDDAASLVPVTQRHPGFSVADGYEVAARLHRRRLQDGARPVGRKIGFTNANIWPQYGVHQPIWGWVYAHTLVDSQGAPVPLSLAGLREPRIEPEIALCLKSVPPAGADVADLVACLEWFAPAFEIVQSHFPGWKFQAADTIADGGLHGRLVLGERRPATALGGDPAAALAGLEVDLSRDGSLVERGRASHALGSPLAALAHLVALLDGAPAEAALRPGEVVTTGTVTAAYPVAPGQRWTATPSAGLRPLALELRP